MTTIKMLEHEPSVFRDSFAGDVVLTRRPGKPWLVQVRHAGNRWEAEHVLYGRKAQVLPLVEDLAASHYARLTHAFASRRVARGGVYH